MPNRILREGIITSERVNSLSWPEEVFYRRVMSTVDDFGRYYAKPELLRAACYPLHLDKVGNSDIEKWLQATEKASLVRTYTVENKEYLEVLDFRQKVRAKQSKFPTCIADAMHVHSTRPTHASLDGDGDGDGDGDDSGKRSKKFKPPELPEVVKFFTDNGFSKEIAIKAFEYYQEGDWYDSTGKPVKNWKQKMRANWFKDENKSVQTGSQYRPHPSLNDDAQVTP